MKKVREDAIDRLEAIALNSRIDCLKFGSLGGSFGAHYGPALSMIEIVTTVLDYANLPLPSENNFYERDRIVLSKGHGSLALYAGLHQIRRISDEIMETCEQDGSLLPGQPVRNLELGIEFSSGSLGMGLGFGVGLALSAKKDGSPRKVFVILGDGETNEGSVWESAMSASHFNLDNLIAVIDENNLQSDGKTQEVMQVQLEAMWEACGWEVLRVDGHSIEQLYLALRAKGKRPRVVIASTVKGKGVSFMEHSVDWHHAVLSPESFELAVSELVGGQEIEGS